ncbi:[acyl-carrier-protein] S-malonyltransferase [Lachnotalea glycerini]|uniref:Malonyl CoA-acyl carrier protein transacylase n=1 Tax=Lachnotalea glycerini TaxID=1763509 RepID=A0A318ETB2_9FIRM|nr:ACP S-malonyltransferase [Lachnotalea glycerini]PXV96231.1 [acyl-carrier-protein] S-malonyltransferase [Lachnotalea glycerini]
MSKIAFVFPGQGTQYFGMGKDFYDNSSEARKIFDIASKLGNIDMEQLCFEENDKLNITKYTQIAMLTVCCAILKEIESLSIKPLVCAGLSLGEYSALVCAGILNFEDAFKIVQKRGIFMQEAVPTGGAMAAIIGFDTQQIENICEEAKGIVQIANYNCPGQIVISGVEEAIEEASHALTAAGAKRVIKLNVSGPFHSKLLCQAGKKLREVLVKAEFKDITIPYVSNVTADYVTDKKCIVDLLEKQVFSSVKWQQSIEKMLESGVDTFVEIGPGKTLSGFIKKIDKSVKVINIDKYDDLGKLDQIK